MAWPLLLSTCVAGLLTFPLSVVAGGTLVVPALSGNFSTSELLPRDPSQGARTDCPWDAAGMVAFPTPTGDDVTLGANTIYLLDSTQTIPGTLTIPEGSSLVFADTTFNLTATSILVYGSLRIGSSTCRTSPTTKHTITLTGDRSDPNNNTVWHKGIVVSGNDAIVEIYGHLYQPSWTRLAATAEELDTVLYLQECVEWPVNSKLLVTTTHRVDWRKSHQNEEVFVAAVSCVTVDYLEDGKSSHNFGRITLSQPLAYKHYAARQEYQAEVALLNRNVLIQGDASSPPTDPQPDGTTCAGNQFTEVPCQGYYLTGYGGHMMFMHNATARLSAVEFYRMGQTNQIGRYPVHLHLLADAGNASFVSDCSVHESYYRGYVVHGTHGALVTRNVAYDVIGHTYYLESGIEEMNEISFNLGAHIHQIGHFLDFQGQESDTEFSAADLGGAVIPADGAASSFYISNMYNNITGNAAVGGFTGFACVQFPKVIGEWPPHVTPDDSFIPMNRPNLPGGFYGNSARSVGWFWNLAPAFYVGGFLATSDWPLGSDGELTYKPGRVIGNKDGVSQSRKPVLDNGDDAWLEFNNSKASLSNVGGGDWNLRSKWYNMDVVDLGERSFNAFGRVAFRNINVRCRTDNGVALDPTPPQTKNGEKIWEKVLFKMFRAYDTGQRHILDSWQISGCGTTESPFDQTFRRAQIWSIPHGVNVNQKQLAMRNITYLDGTPDPVKLISMDVGSKDTYSAFYGTMFDADGSVTMRNTGARRSAACNPTIVGSAGTKLSSSAGFPDNMEPRPVNFWYKLTGLDDGGARGGNESDARCDLMLEAEYPMWACDAGSMDVGSLTLKVNDVSQTTARTKEAWGYLTHFGDDLTAGAEMSGDEQIVGPYDHAHRGGWFLQYWSAADDPTSWSTPRTLEIGDVQYTNGTVLIFALAYPTGTNFTITRRTSWGDSGTDVVPAESLEALRRDTTGLLYYFDGTYLFLKAHQYEVDPYGFGEDGLFIADKNPSFADDWFITAHWDTVATGCGASDDYCRAATNMPPPANVGEIPGQSPVPPCTTSTPFWVVRSLEVAPSEDVALKWDPDARFTAPECNETREWEDIFSVLDAGDAETGGLGKLMVVDEEEVWLCFKEHPCPQAAGLAAGLAGMCYVYHEAEERFLPWGLQDDLNLF